MSKLLSERFFKKVEKSDEGCWEWLGAKTRGGYGHMRYHDGTKWTMKRAHIVSHWLHKGPTRGLLVCHTCDNPSCVNPRHLFLGTHSDNGQDMSRKGRATKGKPAAILSEKEVEDIRRLSKEGMQNKDIATKFKVSRTTISLIINGKRWKEGYSHSL